MLQPQQTLNLSPYGHLYDLLIPKDDELRRIHDEIDMSFVYTELVKNYCDDNGRTAEDLHADNTARNRIGEYRIPKNSRVSEQDAGAVQDRSQECRSQAKLWS